MREALASNDAIWLQDSPANPMLINAVITMDRIDLQTLQDTFRRRILEGPEAGRFERLQQVVTGSGPHHYWEQDLHFDLDRHIFAKRGRPIRTLKGLQTFMGREAAKALDETHPRWQVQVIEEFEADGTALVIRIHHSIGDGVALVSLLLGLADPPRPGKPVRARKALPPPAEPPMLDRLLRAAALPMSAPGILLRRLTWLPDHSDLHGPELSGRKRVAWTQPVDLAVIKQAKRRIGATVNDVLMATVSGAFSAFLAGNGDVPPARFLVSMPVNVRTPGRPPACDNKFAPVPLELPAGADPGARILAVKRKLDELKGSVVPQVIYELQRALLTFLPETVSRGLIDFLANKCTAVVTNVQGPAGTLTLEGRRLRSFLFWVPQRAKIGLGISILSFSGKVQVGVIADEALTLDPAALARAFEAEFEALKAVCL